MSEFEQDIRSDSSIPINVPERPPSSHAESEQSVDEFKLTLRLLPSFKTSRAFAIWQDQTYASVLTCHTRHKAASDWAFPSEILDGSWASIALQSGLCYQGALLHRSIDSALVTAFVERWQPDTNTFHMPWGEMTITLHDVFEILGLSMDGRLVSFDDVTDKLDPMEILADLLKLSVVDISSEITAGALKFSFLYEMAHSRNLPPQVVACIFCLYQLGCSLYQDKSKDRVPVEVLPLLYCDVTAIGSFSWGAATLAYLYRQLGKASRSQSHQLSGHTTLLQCWIYEYFPSFRVNQLDDWTTDQPRARRWRGTTSHRVLPVDRLQAYRRQIDYMTCDKVDWTPYRVSNYRDDTYLLSHFHGCIQFLDVVEPYMPDRVLRQFGRCQSIPKAPIRPGSRTTRPARPHGYRVDYHPRDDMWAYRTSHILRAEHFGRSTSIPYECVDGYMEWYITHSHRFILPDTTVHYRELHPRRRRPRNPKDSGRAHHQLQQIRAFLQTDRDRVLDPSQTNVDWRQQYESTVSHVLDLTVVDDSSEQDE